MTVVTVTGTGAVCSAGVGVDALWAGMLQGRPRLAQVRDELAKLPIRVMHALREITGGPTDQGALMLGSMAAREALARARTGSRDLPTRGRIGLVVGTAMGASTVHERRRSGVEPDAPGGRQPVFSVAGNLARELGVGGPVLSVSNACAASAYAIGLAQEMLDSGECDLVIAIGAEGYSRVALGSFNRLGAVDAQGCRPFAAGRAGTAFGEGAAALVLERPDSAAARGAAPVADLLGSAFSSDAGHATAPDAHGAQSARTFAEARAAAGRHAAPIAAVVPHGTGTQLNDAVEARLLSDAFGAAGVPMYSLKALIGHSGGAAGALAAVSAIEIARHGIVPGNVDVGELDPELPVVLNAEPEPIAGPVAVNAYAFGGNNATLIFGSRS